MLRIGELSRLAQVTVKTLRHYHDEGLLVPDKVDEETNYRYYGASALERVMMIRKMRLLGFSIPQIREAFERAAGGDELTPLIEQRLAEVRQQAATLRAIEDELNVLLHLEALRQAPEGTAPAIEFVEEPEEWVVEVRFQGAYETLGVHFKTLMKRLWRQSNGNLYGFCYDTEYREGDATLGAAVGVRSPVEMEGATSRKIPAGSYARLIHHGSYKLLDASYTRLIEASLDRGLKPLTPSIERYIKGPRLILPRSPKHFVTELRLPLTSLDA